MISFPSTVTEETICVDLVFTRKDVENACKLCGDKNPVHFNNDPLKIIVPGFLVEGRAIAIVMDWARKNGLIGNLAVIKHKQVFPKIRARINRFYRCVVLYEQSNTDQKEKRGEMKFKLLIVDITIDNAYPAYVIDLTIIHH